MFKASPDLLLRCFCASLSNFRAPSGVGEAQSNSQSAACASVSDTNASFLLLLWQVVIPNPRPPLEIIPERGEGGSSLGIISG